ncbi:ribosomal 50S subunit-recycling heat shock protein [Aneurinibacillus soli]|uniref:RQC P-site tRNA stabilizing factor n=1 Tax=Aneurinibacillus soli TaxID=1500254 RepID=A0A0U4WBG5_9BACL|nr:MULTISPECIES: RNA-binding S4 domain-containing protein [Aneurinibacillus]PYE58334.1 ribosomal 50S subunit-recycling heat shock protein [Aneurinibacillus soli]WCN37782.1 RNA-binding S4 domain-containing protein [Aneurinibacillus sp. B1]BAU26187.1 Heat shock protein 15 [Aneurinibacillus soli]
MRLDKYLKVSRLVKRRTLAKEVCDQGRVTINGQAAKSSASVKVGDELAVRYGNKTVTVKVEKLLDTTKKDEAATLYTLLKEEMIPREDRENVDTGIW